MCSNPLHITESIISVVKLGVDYLHLDVMDGNFVNNLALNTELVRETRNLTSTPLNVHLMVTKPSRYIQQLLEYDVDSILLHAENPERLLDNIRHIRSSGTYAGIALDIETPVSSVEKYLCEVDQVLCMNCKTGFSGLAFNEQTYDKINELYTYAQNHGLVLEIISDGGIKLEHLKRLYECGADTVVGGTSLLFNGNGLSNNIEAFRGIGLDRAMRRTNAFRPSSDTTRYRAAVLRKIGSLTLEEKTLRRIAPDEAVVKVMACGICGSDVSRVYEKGMYSPGLVPGHEISGIVIKAGDGGAGMVNKRVVVYPLIPCGECPYCRQEKYNLCQKYDYLGSRCDGGFSDIVIAPLKNLLPIPDNVSYDEASMIEPMAVVLHALRKIPSITNSKVLILGLGPIGLLAGIICKGLCAASVTGVDRNSHKSELAIALGFDAAFPRLGSDLGANFDLIVDCCGSSHLVNAAVPLAGKAASILLIGNSIAGMSLSPEAVSLLLRGEMKVIASWNSNMSSGLDDDWTACIRYLSNKELDPTPLITHTFPLERISEAFGGVRNKEFGFIKVLIHPN